jgi:hypothetical protein
VSEKLNIRALIEDHATRENFTYETIESSPFDAGGAEFRVFKHLGTGKTYRITLEEIPDPRPKKKKKNTHPRRRS